MAGGFQGSDTLVTSQQLHLEAVLLQVAKGWAPSAMWCFLRGNLRPG